MSDLLLHICCGICASGCIQKLKEEGFKIMGFFYNPNIYPESEYKKRLEVTREVSKTMGFELLEGEYDKDIWNRLTEDFKSEPEGGKRCQICFKMRLERTKEKSVRLNIPYFTTTLTLSPHKDSLIINKIGKEIDKDSFLERNFKKREGFKKAIEISKTHNLYRQNYCGCIYSKILNPKS